MKDVDMEIAIVDVDVPDCLAQTWSNMKTLGQYYAQNVKRERILCIYM